VKSMAAPPRHLAKRIAATSLLISAALPLLGFVLPWMGVEGTADPFRSEASLLDVVRGSSEAAARITPPAFAILLLCLDVALLATAVAWLAGNRFLTSSRAVRALSALALALALSLLLADVTGGFITPFVHTSLGIGQGVTLLGAVSVPIAAAWLAAARQAG
jgi:hypothetical protein